MDGCIYRTKDGECDLYAEGGKYQAFCDMENCKDRKPSNADRIRAMSDEELANKMHFCMCPADMGGDRASARNCHHDYSFKTCYECWLDWLKEEAKGEN